MAYYLMADNRRRMPSSAYLKEEMTEATDVSLQYPSGAWRRRWRWCRWRRRRARALHPGRRTDPRMHVWTARGSADGAQGGPVACGSFTTLFHFVRPLINSTCVLPCDLQA